MCIRDSGICAVRHILCLCKAVLIADERITLGFPVSYTHLDVYKRQVSDFISGRKQRFLLFPCRRLLNP